jgi:alpha-glucosidase
LIEGGQEHWVDAPLDTLPLFMRAGAVIPEYPLMQYTGEFEIKELILNIYYAGYGVNSFLYEDHGDTFAYEQNIYTEKKFYLEGNKNRLVISQSAEGLFTPRYDLYAIRLIGLPFKPKKIRSDEAFITDFTWDPATGMVHFKVLKSFQKIIIE